MGDELVVRRPDIADELTALQRGQRVLVAGDGAVVSRRTNRRRIAAQVGVIGAVAIGVGVLQPVVGLAFVGSFAFTWWRVGGRNRQLRAALRAMHDGDVGGAEAALAGVDIPWIAGARWRANVASIRGHLAERRGDLLGAVRCADECIRLLPSPTRGFAIVYWMNQFHRAHWLIALGEDELARAQIAALAMAPTGELYRLELRALTLDAAFAGLGPIPAEATLHDWLRDGLRYNHTGVHLALIAWAFEQRGDLDTAAHAMSEAPGRILGSTEVARRVYPKVWAWIGPRLEAAALARAAAEEDDR